ncbi:MAG: phospho-sugar mutase [Bacillota bacterium]|jgi:phosphoglucomutase
MEQALKVFKYWLQNAGGEVLTDLVGIADDDAEIRQRFDKEIRFGTAGLRGKMGAGINRLNIYTVGRAAAGLGKTLENKKAVIAYDNRFNSRLFAETAAEVLAAQDVKVYLFKEPAPTPMLSFAVRELNCGAGIMITASHNGREYNGFKCYGADGCQMTERAADSVIKAMSDFDYFNLPKAAVNAEAVSQRLIEKYYTAVENQLLNPGLLAETDLEVLYTPLNGTGGKAVMQVLQNCGLRSLQILPVQAEPDGNFATCPKPNPELAEAYEEALKYAKKTQPELILATDPDADRLGIIVCAGGEFKLLSGNEIGCLLLDYILQSKQRKGTLPENPVVIKTVVTAPMAEILAAEYGCEVINLPVGFKYICEQLKELEKSDRMSDFILGFEESNGYLCGSYTGDKDGVLAAALVCEMTAYYKKHSQTLIDRLEYLYQRYGCHVNEIQDILFDGLVGTEAMQCFLQDVHANPFRNLGKRRTCSIADYLRGEKLNLADGTAEKIFLPKNDMLEFRFSDGCSLVIRPSGTESKLKIYYNSEGKTFDKATKIVAEMKDDMQDIIKNYL